MSRGAQGGNTIGVSMKYTCPTHPQVRRPAPGSISMVGAKGSFDHI